MRTIKNREYVAESILSSTRTGKQAFVSAFLEYLDKHNIQYENNANDELKIKSYSYIARQSIIPCRILECSKISFSLCTFSNLTLPLKASYVAINDCSELNKLVVEDGTEITTLALYDCTGDIDLSSLANAKIENISIDNCGITSLKGLEAATKLIVIKNCPNIKSFDLNNENNVPLQIENCQLQSFETPLTSKNVIISNLEQTELDILVGPKTSLNVQDCKKLKTLNVTGDPLEVFVVKNCKKLTNVSCVDCKQSISFRDLPALKKYDLPKISGVCVFDNVPVVPDVKCKKLIQR